MGALVVLFAVPLIAHVLGRGTVGLVVSAACVYGIGVAVWTALPLLPAGLTTGLVAWFSGQTGAIDRTFHTIDYVTLDIRGAILPFCIFASVALVFWLLARWRAHSPPDLSKTLFWVLHLSIIAIPVSMAVFRSRVGMPRRYIDYADAFGWINMIQSFLAWTAIAALTALLTIALRAAFKRLRP